MSDDGPTRLARLVLRRGIAVTGEKFGCLFDEIDPGERQRSRNESDKACHSGRRMQADPCRPARRVDESLDRLSLTPLGAGRFAGVARRNQGKRHETGR